MAVDIYLDGVWMPNASGYSTTEDATPIIASDTTGGVGQTTFTMPERADTRLLIDSQFELRDGTQGVTRGVVRSLASPDKVTTVTADSRMAYMIADRQAAPFQGLLGNAISYYLGLVGITSGIVIDPTLFNTSVVLRGFYGDIWFHLAKNLAPIYKFEISLVSNNIVFRPLRLRNAERMRDASLNFGLDSSDLAQTVIAHYYKNSYRVNGLAYPAGGWNEDVQTYQVGVNQTLEVEVELEASLLSIQQPTAIDFVDRYYVTSSVYSITGKDGLPFKAAQWRASGGRIDVEILPDTMTLKITITAPSDDSYAPYTIAMSSGTGNNYSSLRLVGTGVFTEDNSINLLTGLSVDKAPQEVGAELKNTSVVTIGQAYDAAVWIAHRYSVPSMTISVTTRGVNRAGDNGNYRYPIVDEWNAAYAGLNLDAWNAVWAGQDVYAHDSFWQEKTANDFANQAFGNIVGSRVKEDNAMYRIRSSTVTESSVTYDAEWDTTLDDLNAVWAGATLNDWNAKHGTRRLDKLVIRPLER